MPKIKGKGGKNRRRGKNENFSMKRELELKEEGQEYGQVSKLLGNSRVHVFCFDGAQRVCHIRGKLRKKAWINVGDIILVGLRDYQDDKGDVILKYHPDEARRLKMDGWIPENAKLNENDEQDEEEVEFLENVEEDAESGDEADSDNTSSESDSDESENEEVPDDGEESEEEESEEEEEDSDEDLDDSDRILKENMAAERILKEDTRRGRNRGAKNKTGKE